MSVKKINNVCSRYDDFSRGYDLSTLALQRQGNAQKFGFMITHEGEYIPAAQSEQKGFSCDSHSTYSRDASQNPKGLRRIPDILRPEFKRREDLEAQFANRKQAKPHP
jgi:hypothetical protein